MMRVLFALVLTACAPVVDLPQPGSPFSYHEPPRLIESPTPDLDGPCLQRRSRRHAATWLWKHGRLVAHAFDVGDGLVAATADLPAANALARSARTRGRALLPLFITHGVLLAATFSSLAADILERPNDDRAIALTLGLGFGLLATNLAINLPLVVSSAKREERAIRVYNEWAADHGCRDPPPAPSH